MKRLLLGVTCSWALLALVASTAMAAAEPVVSTGNATTITEASATLNGTVNPEGQATSYYFEYGTTTSYGTRTATGDAGAGTADIGVSAHLAVLSPDTTYHYRLVATNASGATLGSDISFKTPKPPVPVVSTGSPQSITQTSATLRGTVDPEGMATSYVFQYGTSTAYTSETPAASAGSGTKSVSAAEAVGALTPNTTYHYRLAATNANGTTYGHDVSFKTAPVPAGVTIAALPGAITFGQFTSVGGRVLAPRPSHLAVTLQSAVSPGGPWIDAATAAATSTGVYSFPGLAPNSNTYYRVLAYGATSPPVLVSVQFRVALLVSRRHPLRGSRVRFHGHVGPAHDGLPVLIQWLGRRGNWYTIRRSRLRPARGGLSFYSVLVPITKSGRYRVSVGSDASHAAGDSPVVRIRVH